MSTLASNSPIFYREVYQYQYHRQQQEQLWRGGSRCLLLQRTPGPAGGCSNWLDGRGAGNGINTDLLSNKRMISTRIGAFWPDMTRPTTVEMEPINNSDELDQILLEAQQLSEPILIDWMASWCRKCIYLKPKLEKLAAEYHTKIKLYCVDVNKVPQSLVKRGNISKMPTIQLWKNGEMKAEVIGGHKAWLVIEEVREMINKFV